jgi:hypothetical protein
MALIVAALWRASGCAAAAFFQGRGQEIGLWSIGMSMYSFEAWHPSAVEVRPS